MTLRIFAPRPSCAQATGSISIEIYGISYFAVAESRGASTCLSGALGAADTAKRKLALRPEVLMLIDTEITIRIPKAGRMTR